MNHDQDALAKYKDEATSFREKFSRFKDKRIVLYGIGRFTATLLPQIEDFHVVGLMDRDPQKIGHEVYGLPILSIEQAEDQSDLIIINASGTYWNIIYNRIKDTRLPVYYLNGERASLKLRHACVDRLSISQALDLIDQNDIISFDFFDTLFVRKSAAIEDALYLVEYRKKELLEKLGFSFPEQRRAAASGLPRNTSTLDEIYAQLLRATGISREDADALMREEMQVEEDLLCPRRDVTRLFEYAQERGKQVFIVSDMYLSSHLLTEVLEKNGLHLPEEDVWVSCEKRKAKADGGIWPDLVSRFPGKSILHFGDNEKTDVLIPQRYGINTMQVENIRELAVEDGFDDIYSKAQSLASSIQLGMCSSVLWNDALTGSAKTPSVQSEHDMGYAVIGPVVCSFLIYLLQEKQTRGIRRFYFFSRDGYFLEEDYKYLLDLLGRVSESDMARPLYISRYITMLTNAVAKNDYSDLLDLPYSGGRRDFLRSRFQIDDTGDFDIAGDVDEAFKAAAFDRHRTEIEQKAKRTAEEYRAYIEGLGICPDDALVDLSLKGTNQHYTVELLGFNLPCYYFVADMSDQNPFTKTQDMRPYFNAFAPDRHSESMVEKSSLVLESFLTAPYGMVRSVHPDGSIESDKPRSNQIHFDEKREINRGVKDYMKDLITIFGTDLTGLAADVDFVDKLYGKLLDGSIELSARATRSFYYDNALFHEADNPIFS